jgi:hypothetical protein
MLGKVAGDQPQASANAELATDLEGDRRRREERDEAEGGMEVGDFE